MHLLSILSFSLNPFFIRKSQERSKLLLTLFSSLLLLSSSSLQAEPLPGALFTKTRFLYEATDYHGDPDRGAAALCQLKVDYSLDLALDQTNNEDELRLDCWLHSVTIDDIEPATYFQAQKRSTRACITRPVMLTLHLKKLPTGERVVGAWEESSSLPEALSLSQWQAGGLKKARESYVALSQPLDRFKELLVESLSHLFLYNHYRKNDAGHFELKYQKILGDHAEYTALSYDEECALLCYLAKKSTKRGALLQYPRCLRETITPQTKAKS